MKRSNIAKIVLAAVTAAGFGGVQAETPAKLPQIKPQFKQQIQPQHKLPQAQIKPGVIKPQGCPDLTIRRVSVYIVQPQADGRERFNLMVEIRNNGSMEYQHALPRATEMHLYQQDSAGAQRTINRHYVNNVRPGTGPNFFSSYVLWSRSVEFPPNIVAEIRYLDPEFGADASRANDDCQMNNNKFVLTGAEINRQLAAKAARR